MLDTLKLDNDMHEKVKSTNASHHGELTEMQNGHSHKIADISETAGRSLVKDYMVSLHIGKVTKVGKLCDLKLRITLRWS